MVLMWDGKGFDGYYWRAPATYRIQAIWDGDHYSAHGLYQAAMAFYQAAIQDEDLLTWGPEFENYVRPECNSYPNVTPIPPDPQLDEGEPARLAVYAYYHLMLLYTLDGDLAKARSTYETLRQKYSKNNPEFVELAQTFWDEYITSGNISSGCYAAVSYAEANEDVILRPLSTNHYAGLFSYDPHDICPFQ